MVVLESTGAGVVICFDHEVFDVADDADLDVVLGGGDGVGVAEQDAVSLLVDAAGGAGGTVFIGEGLDDDVREGEGGEGFGGDVEGELRRDATGVIKVIIRRGGETGVPKKRRCPRKELRVINTMHPKTHNPLRHQIRSLQTRRVINNITHRDTFEKICANSKIKRIPRSHRIRHRQRITPPG